MNGNLAMGPPWERNKARDGLKDAATLPHLNNNPPPSGLPETATRASPLAPHRRDHSWAQLLGRDLPTGALPFPRPTIVPCISRLRANAGQARSVTTLPRPGHQDRGDASAQRGDNPPNWPNKLLDSPRNCSAIPTLQWRTGDSPFPMKHQECRIPTIGTNSVALHHRVPLSHLGGPHAEGSLPESLRNTVTTAKPPEDRRHTVSSQRGSGATQGPIATESARSLDGLTGSREFSFLAANLARTNHPSTQSLLDLRCVPLRSSCPNRFGGTPARFHTWVFP